MAKRTSADSTSAVVFHDLRQATAALAAAAALGRPIALWSAPAAAIYAGCGWFAALERRARAAVPQASALFVLDCADRADLVQEAFREGITDVSFNGRPAVAERLGDIARKSGARLHRRRARALDLAAPGDAEMACRQLLGGN